MEDPFHRRELNSVARLSALRPHADSYAIEQIAFMTLLAGSTLTRTDIIDYAKSVIDVVIQLSRIDSRRAVTDVRCLRDLR